MCKKEEKYVAVMFPYPSGAGLHVGHYYNYAIIDSYCNYLRYKGEEVFQPFGWDSFGLPAENYAKKVGRSPKDVTYENIENFRNQMKHMNTNYEEKLTTSDESYQKWTQWLFLKLKEHGLAYKKHGDVNYCSSCETVLAREQVKDNKCERCSTEIEIKQLEQWYFKITAYAERLYKNLDTIDYPKSTINAQREWIGKSEGYEINFGNDITVFTTKPQTILDVKFIVKPSENDVEEFTNEYATCPITNKQIPIYTSNYVIKGYGTGYVMGVPNDDKRDREFAIRHSIDFSMDKNIVEDISFAVKKTNYKLHDWCVSRQRSWGCPIPIEGETDTLDTFVDSSFYFIRYCDSDNDKELCSKEKYKQVDLYVGGKEHACMHLIYARFINMFLYDIDVVNEEEPFKKVIHQGIILNEGEKMSKSKGNVVNPDAYDSDVLKFYMMFIGHYFDGGSWSDQNINGIKRFFNKWKAWMEKDGDDTVDIEKFQKTIFDFTEAFKFNKVVSTFMILVNENKDKSLNK